MMRVQSHCTAAIEVIAATLGFSHAPSVAVVGVKFRDAG